MSVSDLKSDAPDAYTVQKGDTLWGLAGRFLKEPWRWPEIWEMNKDQIKNPHRIYPGDVIRLDRSGDSPRLTLVEGMGAEAAASNVVRLEPRVRVETLRTAIPSIPAAAIGPFLSQPLVVDEGGLDAAPTIVATEENRVVVGAGNLAYADRIPGSEIINWQIFRPGRPLRDPDTGEVLGFEAQYVGDARVRRFGSPTTVEVIKARQEVNRGDRLVPTRELGIPTYVPHAPERMIRGSIMSVEGGVSELGQFQVITINRGSRDGMEVGHVLATYRRGALLTRGGDVAPNWFDTSAFHGMDVKPVPVVPDPPRPPPAEGTPVVAPAPGADEPVRLPDERNGLIFVFRVFERMSYAMVMRTNRPIYIGDRVQTP